MAAQTPNTKPEVQFTVPIADLRFDASGDPNAKGSWTMRGHAAVYNRKSHDLGGFRTVIAPTAFDKVLDTNPDVHLLWDHDTRYVLARTRNNSLELRSDPYGLHVWARFAKTNTADEIATLMQGGYIDQMSFACNIGEDEWTQDSSGDITRTIFSVDGLFDVTVCAQGAFPQTDAALVASLTGSSDDLLTSVKEAGRLKVEAPNPDLVASRGESEDNIAPPEGVADVAAVRAARLAAMKDTAEQRYQAAHEQQQ
jgi:HK97 family phage prohead protease